MQTAFRYAHKMKKTGDTKTACLFVLSNIYDSSRVPHLVQNNVPSGAGLPQLGQLRKTDARSVASVAGFTDVSAAPVGAPVDVPDCTFVGAPVGVPDCAFIGAPVCMPDCAFVDASVGVCL